MTILQNTYGITNSTILVSRDKKSLLIYSPPQPTTQFLNDIQDIIFPNDVIKVKYIVCPNEFHDTYSSSAREVFQKKDGALLLVIYVRDLHEIW